MRARRHERRAAAPARWQADERGKPQGSPGRGKAAPGAEIVRREDRIDAAEPQERRQMQAAEHAADDEEGERHQHAAGAAADGVERAGAAAVGELHADAEHEGADDERGPIGAMAPPKPGTSAATGTIAAAAMAMSRRAPSKPSASPRTIRRRHDAVKLNSDLRNTAPSAKPSTRQGRGRRLAVDQHKRDRARRAPAPRRSGTASRDAARAPHGADSVSDAHCSFRLEFPVARPSASRAEAEHLLQIVPRVRERTGRCGSAVHSTIEPS